MKSLLRPTLVRRVVVALLSGFVLAWAALIAENCLTVWRQQAQTARHFDTSHYGVRMRLALSGVEEPAEARAIAAAQERILNEDRWSAGVPGTEVFQVWDRREHRLVYSSPAVANEVLRGNPAQKTSQRLHGELFQVFEVDMPRWAVFWARTAIDIPWLLNTMSKDLVSNMTIAWPFVLLPVWLAVLQGLRPLRRFSEHIAAREPEDISPVGIDPRHAELKPLIRSLDDLLARLRHKIESERVFVANAAHELRTPLAVITAQAHVLAKATTEAERVDAERRLDEAIARSSHLIHQLLALARVEMERPAEPVTLDLAQLVRAELAHFAPAAFAHNIEISLEAPDRLLLRWEVHSIQSVVQNLVDNAIRYGRDGGRIVVEIQPLVGAIRLSVADDGPGIAESDRLRIFDRFYRGAQRDEVSGTGLGLTIVKQAVARMGGSVQLGEGLDGCGCSFTLMIPDASVQPPLPGASGVARADLGTWIEALMRTRKKSLLALAVAAAVAVPLGLHGLTGRTASAQTTPSPTAASLRRYIDSLEAGKPNYEEMSPLLADTVREQLPQIEAIIHRMGAFQSMVFKGVDGNGMELYEVTFEHGRAEWRIAPLTSDGKVVRRGFRVLPQSF